MRALALAGAHDEQNQVARQNSGQETQHLVVLARHNYGLPREKAGDPVTHNLLEGPRQPTRKISHRSNAEFRIDRPGTQDGDPYSSGLHFLIQRQTELNKVAFGCVIDGHARAGEEAKHRSHVENTALVASDAV